MKNSSFLVNLATDLVKNNKPVIYVAGKVTGLPEAEVKAKFLAAKWKLEADGYKVLNPCDYIEHNEPWETAMRKASTILNMADTIYLLSDWANSDGARWEFAQAAKFGLNVIFQ